MRGRYNGLRGDSKVANDLPLLLISANWEAWFKQAEIMAGTKLHYGQG